MDTNSKCKQCKYYTKTNRFNCRRTDCQTVGSRAFEYFEMADEAELKRREEIELRIKKDNKFTKQDLLVGICSADFIITAFIVTFLGLYSIYIGVTHPGLSNTEIFLKSFNDFPKLNIFAIISAIFLWIVTRIVRKRR